MLLQTQLTEYINDIDFANINNDRKEQLTQTAQHIKSLFEESQSAKLTFICTHNSRRSMFGQIWAKTAAAHYDIEFVETYSGGTEATAFNERAVAAIERSGFKVMKEDSSDNPLYKVFYNESELPIECYSKVYDVKENPQNTFIAIMTCDHADENCPFIPGATKRMPLTYIDPKVADGTANEKSTYDERCKQIATEMFFTLSQVKTLL